MSLIIRPETRDDQTPIWDVNHAAFGQPGEANLVDALRASGDARISLVAELDHQVVGHILFSTIQIMTSDRSIEALSLAPMAVLPSHQRKGLGGRLVVEGLNECLKIGGKIVIVLGHPDFYPRFGFSAHLARSLTSPFGGGDAWMAKELTPGSLTGVEGRVEYSPPFTAFE